MKSRRQCSNRSQNRNPRKNRNRPTALNRLRRLILPNLALPIEPGQIAAPVALAVSVDDFAALEQRVMRAVEMLRHERHARAAAEVRIAQAEEYAAKTLAELGPLHAQINQQTPLIAQLQSEVTSLRAERDAVKNRVEKLLEQLDSLEM